MSGMDTFRLVRYKINFFMWLFCIFKWLVFFPVHAWREIKNTGKYFCKGLLRVKTILHAYVIYFLICIS